MDYACDVSKSLNKNLKIIEAITDQTAVHRKKFEFALSQITKFTKKYGKVSKKNKKLTTEKKDAAIIILQDLNELREIMGEYLLETWTNSTINNPSNTVLNLLKELFSDLKEKSTILSEKCSKYIMPDSDEWIQYHILDLRAIQASFTQYLNIKNNDTNKPPSEHSEINDKMEQRLISINREITISNGENISPSNSKFSVTRSFSPIPVNYRQWLVSIDDFEFHDAIGSGVSATVYHGIHKRTGEEVAIKEFKWIKMNGSRLQSFQREVAVLATVNHPTLLKLIGATDTPPFCIITEWMPNGSLFKNLHDQVLVDPTQKMIAAFDVARGMQYLHAHQIVHRDLKSLNVLMDGDMRIRICDFAFSRHAANDQTMTSNIGTPHWMAPEILFSNQNYTAKVDVYAYGVLLWELVTSQIPYNGVSGRMIMYEVRDRDIRPTLPSSDVVNPSIRDLITQCWDRNPDLRPSFDEIVRRFIDDKVRIDGTDDQVFNKYIRTSSTISEIVNKKVLDVFERAVKLKEISLGAAVRKIRKLGGIPIELIDKIWRPEIVLPQFAHKKSDTENEEIVKESEKVEKLNDDEESDDDYEYDNENESSGKKGVGQIENGLSQNGDLNAKKNSVEENQLSVSDEDAAQYLLLFNKTSKIGEVARVLRNLRGGSVPRDVMCEFIAEVPTGSNDVDADIVVAACRNGCADFASLYASRDADVSLALLVSACCGVDVTLRAAVTDLCVTCLATSKAEESCQLRKVASEGVRFARRSRTDMREKASISSSCISQSKREEAVESNTSKSKEANKSINTNSEQANESAVNNNSNKPEDANESVASNSEKANESTVNNNSSNFENTNENVADNSEQANSVKNSLGEASESTTDDQSQQENRASACKSDETATSCLISEEASSNNVANNENSSTNSNEDRSTADTSAATSNNDMCSEKLENHLNLISSKNRSSASNNLSSSDGFISSSALTSSYMELINDSSPSSMKNASALLCLVGIGKLKRITQLILNGSTNFMLWFLRSNDKSLKNAALVASVALAKEGYIFHISEMKCEMKNNQNENEVYDESEVDKLFNALLDMMEDENLATSAIVNVVSKEKYYAEKLISKVEKSSKEINENVLKTLIAAAKIKQLCDKIKSTMEKLVFKDELKMHVQRFLSLI